MLCKAMHCLRAHEYGNAAPLHALTLVPRCRASAATRREALLDSKKHHPVTKPCAHRTVSAQSGPYGSVEALNEGLGRRVRGAEVH